MISVLVYDSDVCCLIFLIKINIMILKQTTEGLRCSYQRLSSRIYISMLEGRLLIFRLERSEMCIGSNRTLFSIVYA